MDEQASKYYSSKNGKKKLTVWEEQTAVNKYDTSATY